MTQLRPELPEPTTRISALPVDERGYPVPWFVAWIDGKPDHRVMDGPKREKAWVENLCWICGQPLGGVTVSFAIGPMCAVNRTSAEPPSHKECCLWSVKACPFLSRPHAHRREVKYENVETVRPDGNMLERNPGVILVWTAKRHKVHPFRLPDGGFLFHIGEPEEALFFTEGRPSTRFEIEESINTGLPFLKDAAEQDGPDAVLELETLVERAWELIPA